MITAFLVLLSARSLQLSDFAPLVFESQIMRGWDVMEVAVGRSTHLPGKISAHWWARGKKGAIHMLDVHLVVQPQGQDAMQTLKKWASSGSAGLFDLEKPPHGWAGRPVSRGAVMRAAADNVAAMATVGAGQLDETAVAVARRLADEALKLGESFVRGKRAKATSIASRGAKVPSSDPDLDLVSAAMYPAFVNRIGGVSLNPLSSTGNDPHFPATVFRWEYAGAKPYPYIDSQVIVFGDAKLAAQVAEGLPGTMFGDCARHDADTSVIYVDARTGKRLPDPSHQERGPLYRSSTHWGYVMRKGRTVLSCEYMLSGFKPASEADRAFAKQARQTLALGGR